MNKAFTKDILRTIKKSKKRFFAIMIITALGVTVLSGIYAAVQDMYHSADRFFDEQQLFDIRIMSSLGLTDDDITALSKVSGIEEVSGSYSETVNTSVGEGIKEAEVTVLLNSGLNTPYLVEGKLPSKQGEIAVTQAYMQDANKKIGDTLTFQEIFDDGDDDNSTTTADTKSQAVSDEANTSAIITEKKDDSITTEIDWDADVDIEEEAEAPTFKNTSYTITAQVLNPLNISDGSLTFRASTASDYNFFITKEDADFDVYTSVYITLPNLKELNSFTPEYENTVQNVINVIEKDIREGREQARYDGIINDALQTIADAEGTMEEKFADADKQFADAWTEIADAKKELTEGEEELTKEEKDALSKLADGKKQLSDAKAQIATAKEELATGELQLEEGAAELIKGKQELQNQRVIAQNGFTQAETIFGEKQGLLNGTISVLEGAKGQLQQLLGDKFPTAQWDALVGGAAAKTAQLLTANPTAEPNTAEIAGATAPLQNALAGAIGEIIPTLPYPVDQAQITEQSISTAMGMGITTASMEMLEAQKKAFEQEKQSALQKLDAGEREIAQGEAQIEVSRGEIAQGKIDLATGEAEILKNEAKLKDEEKKALAEIADAWAEIADGKQELADGQTELEENQEKYLQKKDEANQKIEDAYAELKDIDMTEWYVLDRTSLDSYSGLKNDMNSIQAVGNAFPIVFLIVAVLISLTTMTRMVEEDRGLTGTYKALGIKDSSIYAKYMLYAFFACLFGGILGDILGFIVLPTLLIGILQVMYTIPQFYLIFDTFYGLAGVLLFMVSIVVSTGITCHMELKQMPAALMRPKAPKAGSRVFMERIPFIWSRMRFLNKVTARNLFRYKKRLFMTILGIAGCTALVLIGFGIRDSVTSLMPKQYDNTYRYDLLAVVDGKDNAKWIEEINADAGISKYLNLQISNFKLKDAKGEGQSVQLTVVPTGQSLADYINLTDINGKQVELTSNGILVTQNAAELLKLNSGDTVTMENMLLARRDVTVENIVQNYLGNNAYITQDLYEKIYDDFAKNGILANFGESVTDPIAYTQELQENEAVLSAVSTQALKEDFATNFTLLNSVVYIFIVLAAGLAFVVLFTLSNTNISERERELATIKVLGFFDREVHSYVNKETLILTLLGIFAGLPAGRFLAGLLTSALKMPALYFAVEVEPSSYIFSAIISFCFALIVNLMINRTLDKINMVEALKSVE